jgi:hypothetical protein
MAMPARAFDHPRAAPPRDPNRAQHGEIVALAGWTTDRRRMAMRRDPVTGRLVITTLDWSAEPFQHDTATPIRH